jgi:hypothetical protein
MVSGTPHFGQSIIVKGSIHLLCRKFPHAKGSLHKEAGEKKSGFHTRGGPGSVSRAAGDLFSQASPFTSLSGVCPFLTEMTRNFKYFLCRQDPFTVQNPYLFCYALSVYWTLRHWCKKRVKEIVPWILS